MGSCCLFAAWVQALGEVVRVICRVSAEVLCRLAHRACVTAVSNWAPHALPPAHPSVLQATATSGCSSFGCPTPRQRQVGSGCDTRDVHWLLPPAHRCLFRPAVLGCKQHNVVVSPLWMDVLRRLAPCPAQAAPPSAPTLWRTAAPGSWPGRWVVAPGPVVLPCVNSGLRQEALEILMALP